MKKPAIVIVSVLLIQLSACQTTRSSIEDIHNHPKRYSGKSVIVEGVVTDSIPAPLAEGYLFRIYEGNSDSIWIYTKGSKPERGRHVTVTGVVSDNDSLRNRLTGSYLIEESRTDK